MRLYLSSLARLRDDPQGWQRIYPGHGPMIADGRRTVREYIDHRQHREAQILRQMDAATPGVGALSPRDLVEVMYRDRPLSHELRAAATETVYNHLLWLRDKGHVVMHGKAGTDGGVVGRPDLGARWVRCV